MELDNITLVGWKFYNDFSHSDVVEKANEHQFLVSAHSEFQENVWTGKWKTIM